MAQEKIVICIDASVGVYPERDERSIYAIKKTKRFRIITNLYKEPFLGATALANSSGYSRPNKISDECKGINEQFNRHTGLLDKLIIYSKESKYSLNKERFIFKPVRNF